MSGGEGDAAPKSTVQPYSPTDRGRLSALCERIAPLEREAQLEAVRVDQEERFVEGRHFSARLYYRLLTLLRDDGDAFIDIAYQEYLLLMKREPQLDLAEFVALYPEIAEGLRRQLELDRELSDSSWGLNSRDGAGATSVPVSENLTNPNPEDFPATAVGGGEAEGRPNRAPNFNNAVTQQIRLKDYTPVIPGYEVFEMVGSGGMGVVYRARHWRLDRYVALKMMRDGRFSSAEHRVRFVNEAQTLAMVHHAHVIQIFEINQVDTVPFFAMELLSGGSLADRLKAGRRYTPMEAAKLLEMLARGIHVAHQKNILHRDLKPGNILFDGDGVPRIADFGLARRGGSAGLTESRAGMGTMQYSSPEQFLGNADRCDCRSDVYSLGIILYECIAGHRPYWWEHKEEVPASVAPNQEPRPLRSHVKGVSRDLEAIILKCIERDSPNRYASALDLAEDLKHFQAGEPTIARPLPAVGRFYRRCRRNPLVAALVSVVAFQAGVITFLLAKLI